MQKDCSIVDIVNVPDGKEKEVCHADTETGDICGGVCKK